MDVGLRARMIMLVMVTVFLVLVAGTVIAIAMSTQPAGATAKAGGLSMPEQLAEGPE